MLAGGGSLWNISTGDDNEGYTLTVRDPTRTLAPQRSNPPGQETGVIDIRRLEEGPAPAAVVGEYGHLGSVSVPVSVSVAVSESGSESDSGSASVHGLVSVSRTFRGSLEARK